MLNHPANQVFIVYSTRAIAGSSCVVSYLVGPLAR